MEEDTGQNLHINMMKKLEKFCEKKKHEAELKSLREQVEKMVGSNIVMMGDLPRNNEKSLNKKENMATNSMLIEKSCLQEILMNELEGKILHKIGEKQYNPSFSPPLIIVEFRDTDLQRIKKIEISNCEYRITENYETIKNLAVTDVRVLKDEANDVEFINIFLNEFIVLKLSRKVKEGFRFSFENEMNVYRIDYSEEEAISLRENTLKFLSGEDLEPDKDELIAKLNDKIKKLDAEIIEEIHKNIKLYNAAKEVVNEYGCHESEMISEKLGKSIYKLGLLIMKEL